MKMVFSPKLSADSPCSGCMEHKSHITVPCVSPPVKELVDDSSFGDATLGKFYESKETREGLLCEMCGALLELKPNQIINASYLTGDKMSQEPVVTESSFDDSPLGNIGCAQISLAVSVKKAVKEIITISDDDDAKSPIGQSRRTMQFKRNRKQESNQSRTGTIKKEMKRPFACKVCFKTYIREHALKAHMKIHKDYSPVKLNENGINANLFSRNADLENNFSGPVIEKRSVTDSSIQKSSVINSIIEKSSIPDDEINELLLSSDDEIVPPIFMSKLESTTKKESMENTNSKFHLEEDFPEDHDDLSKDDENLSESKRRRVPSVVCPQIMKESARNEIAAKKQQPRSCWCCLSVESSGPWQVHKYQHNKYLCSTCFHIHKAKAEIKQQQEKLGGN